MISAHGTLRIPPDFEFLKCHLQRIIKHESADERRTPSQDQFYTFRGLQTADQAWQNSQHASFGTAGHFPRWRRFRVKAPITGPVGREEYRRLSIKAKYAAVHIRFLQQNAGVVHKVTRGEIVGPIDDNIVRLQDGEGVGRSKFGLEQLDLYIWIDGLQPLPRGLQFGTADIGRSMNDLPLQITEINHIEVHDADTAYTRCRQVKTQRRAKAAGSNQQNTC